MAKRRSYYFYTPHINALRKDVIKIAEILLENERNLFEREEDLAGLEPTKFKRASKAEEKEFLKKFKLTILPDNKPKEPFLRKWYYR